MGKTCAVAFKDLEGITHSVEVEADSLYEAAVLAIRAYRKASMGTAPGLPTRFSIRVTEPQVAHEVQMHQVQRWLEAAMVPNSHQANHERQRPISEAVRLRALCRS